MPAGRARVHTALLLALLGCPPAALLLPRAWAWENGVLEIAQVLALLAGAVLACAAWRRERPSPLALLALCALPFWIVLAAREISWGAVLGLPFALTQDGPLYSSDMLWYKPLVAPAIGLLLGWIVLGIWCRRLDLLLWRLARERRIPWCMLGMAVLAQMGSNCAEGRLGCTFMTGIASAMVCEELVELLAYVALVLAQTRVLARPAPIGAATPIPEESVP